MSVFSFKSIGHYIATGIEAVKTFLTVNKSTIENDLQLGAGIISLVNPGAGAIASLVSRAGSALLGDAIAVINAADAATQEKGVSLTLDAALVQSIKDLAAQLTKLNPSLTAAPAGLPVTAPHA